MCIGLARSVLAIHDAADCCDLFIRLIETFFVVGQDESHVGQSLHRARIDVHRGEQPVGNLLPHLDVLNRRVAR